MDRKNLVLAFGQLSKSGLPEQIVARLLALIQEKHLRPGDRLPPERELATALGVGRPSLREALRVLAMMNIIDIRQGSGTYVTSLDPRLLVEHLDFVFSLDDSTFIQLLEARKIVEIGLVSLAVQRNSDEEIAGLLDCLARSEQCVDDHESFLQTDLELHQRITAAARNPVMARFMAALTQLGTASRRRTVEMPGMAQRALMDHREIVMAIKDRDATAACQAMLKHLNNVEQQLRELLSYGPSLPAPDRVVVEDPGAPPCLVAGPKEQARAS